LRNNLKGKRKKGNSKGKIKRFWRRRRQQGKVGWSRIWFRSS
jgi:hypothetical protein